MRIIGGESKGMKLLGPKDMKTRPMTDRVKESLFNILSYELEDAFVLDLFAGSGSMGIEALSRGAKFCTFVECYNKAFKILQLNIEKTNYKGKSQVIKHDSFQIQKILQENIFDIFFIDPPYLHFDNPVNRRKFMDYLAQISFSYAKSESIFVLHYRKGKMAGMPLPHPFKLQETRLYGTSELMFLEVNL